jgi:hypothetical protein
MQTLGCSFGFDSLKLISPLRENGHWKIEYEDQVPYQISNEYSPKGLSEDVLQRTIQLAISRINTQYATLPPISIALPYQYTLFKKVSIDQGEEINKQQIEWQLKQLLHNQLENYKIINSRTKIDLSNFTEYILFAVRKDILSAIQTVMEKQKLTIKNMTTASMSLINLLQFQPDYKKSDTTIIIRHGKSFLYYLVIIESIIFRSDMYSILPMESAEEKIKDITKQYRTILQSQIPAHEKIDHIFYFSADESYNVFERLKRTLPVKNFMVPIQNCPLTFMEALGASLTNE